MIDVGHKQIILNGKHTCLLGWGQYYKPTIVIIDHGSMIELMEPKKAILPVFEFLSLSLGPETSELSYRALLD